MMVVSPYIPGWELVLLAGRWYWRGRDRQVVVVAGNYGVSLLQGKKGLHHSGQFSWLL
jgi:hypothetical protein